MENKSHLLFDKWLLFCNTRLLLSGRRDCCRDAEIAEDALDFEREERTAAEGAQQMLP